MLNEEQTNHYTKPQNKVISTDEKPRFFNTTSSYSQIAGIAEKAKVRELINRDQGLVSASRHELKTGYEVHLVSP